MSAKKYVIKEVYKASETIDELGRLGATIGYFVSSTNAKEAVQGQGWYGGDGRVTTVKCLVVDGDAFIITDDKPVLLEVNLPKRMAELRQKALDKLSNEEKAALGLKG